MKLPSRNGIWIGIISVVLLTLSFKYHKSINNAYTKQNLAHDERLNEQFTTQMYGGETDEMAQTTRYLVEETTDITTPEFTTTADLNFEETLSLKNDSYDSKIAKRFAARYKQMYKNCPQTEPKPGSFKPTRDILVNLNHGLEVCVTGKSGSSSWHHLIWQLRRYDRGMPYDLELYTNANTKYNHATSILAQHSDLLNTWTHGVDDDFFTEPNQQKIHRVFAGRHPFARLISGWNQKTRRRTDIDEMHFINLNPRMKWYKAVKPDEDHVMSWEDWAHYISVHKKMHFKIDYHFTVATEVCSPCKYYYTYIVKLESLSEDYDWLMRRLNLTGDIKLGSAGEPADGSKVKYNPGLSIQKYMRRLPPKVVQDLYALYKPDFERFGYTFDMNTYMAGGFE